MERVCASKGCANFRVRLGKFQFRIRIVKNSNCAYPWCCSPSLYMKFLFAAIRLDPQNWQYYEKRIEVADKMGIRPLSMRTRLQAAQMIDSQTAQVDFEFYKHILNDVSYSLGEERRECSPFSGSLVLSDDQRRRARDAGLGMSHHQVEGVRHGIR